MNKKYISKISILILFSFLISSTNTVFAKEIKNSLNKEVIVNSLSAASSTSQTPIVGKPSTTVAQMKLWAKGKNANQTFINLAQTFYDISVERGIDPAVVYTQSAKETGYMKFGGVLDASYYNPCGMKNSAGGGDYDGEAHKRFKSWKDGITAQVDHLALYAGHTGYPKFSQDVYEHYIATNNSYGAKALLDYKKNGTTTDPRHFPYLMDKKVTTVESLGKNWAPSETYGHDIVKMMKELYSYPSGVTPTDPNVKKTVTRYFGADRYGTAKKINSIIGNSSTTAVISSGTSFPDTLIAATLAVEKNATLYINKPNSITVELDTAISNNKIKEAYLVGGNSVTSYTKNRFASKGVKLTTISGTNRYQTSAILASHMKNKSTIILANGNDFADALSAAPAAQQKGYPLLLTNGTSLDPSVESLLKKASNVIVIGGDAAVSSNIKNKIRNYGVKVQEKYGADRYGTSLRIAKDYYSSISSVVFASGLNYPDALAGTVLANKLSSPILLVNGSNINKQKSYILEKNPINAYILGGDAAISNKLENDIKNYFK
ncbi:cell wall-binding repeat-containing protein [Miniphocaeibacter massiliensis]|uniref:cell wall-binding repeat-containing protein n=1 Tax=Miniphocaeibacter massiliensis TaxID=2041841 RepID=UPI000C1C6850|nr:cell wall-binding repeat-containing protein [Miniphocaeibacter massiliensis]